VREEYRWNEGAYMLIGIFGSRQSKEMKMEKMA
jgi:hypothetical protein